MVSLSTPRTSRPSRGFQGRIKYDTILLRKISVVLSTILFTFFLDLAVGTTARFSIASERNGFDISETFISSEKSKNNVGRTAFAAAVFVAFQSNFYIQFLNDLR